MPHTIQGFSRLTKDEKIAWLTSNFLSSNPNATQILKQYWNDFNYRKIMFVIKFSFLIFFISVSSRKIGWSKIAKEVLTILRNGRPELEGRTFGARMSGSWIEGSFEDWFLHTPGHDSKWSSHTSTLPIAPTCNDGESLWCECESPVQCLDYKVGILFCSDLGFP